MKPTEVTIQTMFERERQYLIPLFQRHYVWGESEQWLPLWEDIVSKAEKRETNSQREAPKHFTGALVVQQKSTSSTEVSAYEIIDGQQRLTTFQVVLCAFRNVCREQAAEEEADDAERLLVNTGMRAKKGNGKYKLIPTQFDRAAMAFLVDHNSAIDKDAPTGRLINAYKYFYRQIKGYVGNDKDKATALLTAIRDDFGFVEILIDSEDEPEMIFESLNARGKELLEFDLLRNYLFLRTRQSKGEDRDELYKQYWEHFETDRRWDSDVKVGRTKITLSELFLQHFLMARLATETVNPLFQTYRKAHESASSGAQTGEALKTLHGHSQEYLPLAINDHDSPVGRAMRIYHHLDITSLRPFFLYLLAEAGVSDNERDHIFHALESYTVRRVLCTSQGHKDFNKFFPDVIIRRLRSNGFSTRKLLALLEEQETPSRKWPQNSEVKDAFGGQWSIAGVNVKIVRYILYRIECQIREENPRAEDSSLRVNSLTLEHIMPRAWKGKWELPTADGGVLFNELFTEEYKNDNVLWYQEMSSEHLVKEAYAEALNRVKDRMANVQNIGNLTLLTLKLNSSVSNAPFKEKKQGMGGNSLLFLNRDVCAEEDWDVAQIKAREARLCDIFCNKLWPNAQWFLGNIPSE